MIRRRQLLVAVGVCILVQPTAHARTKQVPIVIGWLETGSRESAGQHFAAFKDALGALGWKEGSRVVFADYWANGELDKLPALAEAVKAAKPAVIVTAMGRATNAAATGVPNTPVVQATGGSPVDAGLAVSMARPGKMVTGVTNLATDVSEKNVELLLSAVPGLKRIGFLVDANVSFRRLAQNLERVRRSTARFAVEARIAEVGRPEELGSAISRLAKDGAQALVVLPTGWFQPHRERILKLALARRWPTICGARAWVERGALLSYGVDISANYRRAAYYVDRILRGTKPGDLPIEQPAKFELVVNMKAAKALGLTLPQPFLMRADRVIE